MQKSAVAVFIAACSLNKVRWGLAVSAKQSQPLGWHIVDASAIGVQRRRIGISLSESSSAVPKVLPPGVGSGKAFSKG